MPVLTSLADFSSEGSTPQGALTADAKGDLLGTASNGPNGHGTVFEIVNSGTLAAPIYGSVPAILVAFNGSNGDEPESGVITDARGDLFGTTPTGGANSKGNVFEISKTATGYASLPTVLAIFDGADGDRPSGGLIADSNGNLFGTTAGGGAYDNGTVFEIVNYGTLAAPNYSSIPTTLVSFNGGTNGGELTAGLIADADGDLFGTTIGGGADGSGTVFEIVNNGTLAALNYAGIPTILANMSSSDGPSYGGLIADANGDLFGTTNGNNGADANNDYGTVFEIAKTATGYASAPTILLKFSGGDGNSPVGGLIADADGDLFGTTVLGGADGDGTVFEIVNNGTLAAPSYASTPSVLGSFNNANGRNPASSLITDGNGDLFGETANGGPGGAGIVFEITNSGFAHLTISGTVAGQGTTSETPVDPFSSVTIDDPSVGAMDALTITLSDGGSTGTLSGTGLAGGTGGVYTLSGTATVISTELEALSFAPALGAPGSIAATTFALSDQSTSFAAPAVDDTTTVTDADPPVAPTISGTHGTSTTADESVAPFTGVTIDDLNVGATNTLTITLSGGGATGTLSGTGLAGGTGGVYTLSGTATAISTELEALSFAPTVGAPGSITATTFALGDQSTSFAMPTIDNATTVTDTDPAIAPTVGGSFPGQHTAARVPIQPFSAAGTRIADLNVGATDTLTIVLSGSGATGALTGAGLSGGTNGVYTLTGTAAQITYDLDPLTFTPAASATGTITTTTLTLSDVSSAGTSFAPVVVASVIDTGADAPTISGTAAGQQTHAEALVNPFSGVIVGDLSDGADTLTITLSNGANGTLSGTDVTGGAGGVYALTDNTAGGITAALAGVTFTPAVGLPGSVTTTNFTLSDTSTGFLTPATDGTTTVTDIDPTVAPIISGTHVTPTAAEGSVAPFTGVTIDDLNVRATDTLIITLGGAGGTLADGTGFSGLAAVGGGTYGLAGTPSVVTAELDALVFTPTAGAPDSSSTTTFALSDLSSADSTIAGNSTTSVIDSDPAVPPTIAGTVPGQTTTSEAPVRLFARVTIGDANVGATDTLTITLGGTGGTLFDGIGSFSLLKTVGAGVCSLSGTEGAITDDLDGLVFRPTAGAPGTNSTTTFTLSDQSSAGGAPVVDSMTNVIDGDPASSPPTETSSILWQNTSSGQASFWEMDGSTLVGGGPVTPDPGPSFKEIGTGDFDKDGHPDILWQNMSTGEASIWEMNGSSLNGGGPVTPNPGLNFHAVATGDFNGDGFSDILWQNTLTGQASIWEMNGNTLEGGGPVTPNPGPSFRAVGTGDFNKDGDADIVWQNTATGQVSIWEMQGNKLIGGGPVTPNPGTAWQAIGTGDFNHDGFSDILLQNSNTGAISIWEMNGTGLIGGGQVANPGLSWHAIGTGANGSDILLQNTSGQATIWDMSGTNITGGGPVTPNPGPSWHAIGLT